MSIQHCMVNGKRCSKCCEVILLRKGAFSYAWMEYARHIRKGNVSDEDMLYVRQCFSEDSLKVLVNLKRIKKRIAKKRNPHLFKNNRLWTKQSNFYACVRLTDDGCGDYNNRPVMCSGYPYYGKTKEEWEETVRQGKDSSYDENCTFFIELK